MAAPGVDKLNPKQERALLALLSQPIVKQAAESCGVGERTLHAWLEVPAFAAAYRRARRESFGHAVSVAQRYAALAVNTLAKLLTDPTSPHAVKVSALTAILKFSRESIELDELLGRIESLESAAARASGQGSLGG